MARLRIEAIASFISKEDKVIDIGCDHAYLAIHLVRNKMCQKVVASDIHENALKSAKKNIQSAGLEKEIPTYLADGFLTIHEDVDTAVLSGMGASTILHILKEKPVGIKKLVLQSNNDLYFLRCSLEKIGFYLNQEQVVFEKGHYYVIGLYTLHGKRLSKREKRFGLYDKKNNLYYQYLNQKLHFLVPKKGKKSILEKIKMYFEIWLLKKYL